MNGVAAAEHESDSEFKQANGTAAACCPTAAAAALLRLYIVIEGARFVDADALTSPVGDIDQMNGAAAARHEFVSDLFALEWLRSSVLAGSCNSRVLGRLHDPLLLAFWLLDFWRD